MTAKPPRRHRRDTPSTRLTPSTKTQAVATFIHQMVPHHNNAVNMAKILLKMDVLDPEDEDDAGMIDMLWAIINAQNYQNHNMEAYLDAKGLPAIGASPASEIRRPKLTRPRPRR